MEKQRTDILNTEDAAACANDDFDRLIEQTRRVVVKRKGEAELEATLSKEEEWLVLYYRSFPKSRQQEFIETIKTMARITLQNDYR